MLAICPPSTPAAEASTLPVPGDSAAAGPGAAQPAQPKSVLILSGTQYGLPASDALIADAVSTQKDRGISANDIYVEHLDLVRNHDPRWRAALASLLRDKLARTRVGFVIVANQAALQFLAQEGYELVPANTPVLTALALKPVAAWRGTPLPVLNISSRGDVSGTLRYGLDLFPATRRLLIVAGVHDPQYPLAAQVARALAATGRHLEVENTEALSHHEMLQRVSPPPDTLVLMGTYFKDRTGRSFIPAEVAAEVARRANAPALGMYDAHVRQGLTCGSVVLPASVGRRAGEIGAEFLSGQRRFDGADVEAMVQPQPMFDWTQLQRWGADPAKLPRDTLFLHRPHTLWTDYRTTVIVAGAVFLVLSALVVALVVVNRRRQRVEQALREYQQHLEARVEARTSELIEAKHQAEAASEAKGTFLANMSHEIRTPISAIIGITHLVPRSSLTPQQRDQVGKIQSSSQHLLGISNDILDFSKIEADKLSLEQVEFDLDQVLDSALDLFAGKAADQGLVLEPAPGLPPRLLGDPRRLGQVLINLVGNAVKFTEHGTIGVRVLLQSEQADAVALRFEVHDTGIGMTAHLRAASGTYTGRPCAERVPERSCLIEA